MLTDRFGPRKIGVASLLCLTLGTAIVAMGSSFGIFVAVGCGGTALLLYLIPQLNHHAAVLSISIGIITAILTPAIFSLPAELLPESVMGLGFGILGTVAGIGMAVGPFIVGSLRDATGDYLWRFAAMAIFPALGIMPMLILRMRVSERG